MQDRLHELASRVVGSGVGRGAKAKAHLWTNVEVAKRSVQVCKVRYCRGLIQNNSVRHLHLCSRAFSADRLDNQVASRQGSCLSFFSSRNSRLLQSLVRFCGNLPTELSEELSCFPLTANIESLSGAFLPFCLWHPCGGLCREGFALRAAGRLHGTLEREPHGCRCRSKRLERL